MARAALELPRGTVTFLFTDVDGSTRLLTALGDASACAWASTRARRRSRGMTYVGLDVHRAARNCSAAHGGHVLVSRTTRELVAGALPGDDVTLRDLGPRALRDVVRPEHLFEVVTD